MNLLLQPISTLTAMICSGEITCTRLVQECFNTITVKEQQIHAFLHLQPELAFTRARFLDSLPDAVKSTLPLLGIPIAIKDNICIQNIPTTCGSKILSNFISPFTASTIENLLDAGAIVIGKTNMDEFGMGSSTENSAFGITRNPHNLLHVPGGSSGGSAAAVASQFVVCALGSDTGGSIRQPASHCGVTGLKPTYGRVSRYGLIAFASSLDQIGPLCHRAEDAGLLLSILSKPDKRDSTCASKQFFHDVALYTDSLKGFKIGIDKHSLENGLNISVRTAIEKVIELLVDAGAECVEVPLESLKHSIPAYYVIATAQASSNLARFDGVKYGLRSKDIQNLSDLYCKSRQQGFGSEVKRRIMLGTYVLSAGYYDALYVKALRVSQCISNDFNSAFKVCDVLISPVSASTAFRIGELVNDPVQMYLSDLYTVSVNLAGIPAMTVPCAKDSVGLPIGVQFLAPQWHEDRLLKVSHITQKLCGLCQVPY